MIIENFRTSVRFFSLTVLAVATISTSWSATPTEELTQADQIRRLTERVGQLEQLLGEVQSNPALTAASEGESAYPKVRLSGFADFNYRVRRSSGRSTNHFELGEMDLFITGKISADASIIVENVIAAEDSNNFGDDIERLIFEYHINDSLIVDVGRYHTAIGYYNSAFHHGTWFQTATGRPSFLNFEDAGGILPVHSVGISVHGALPSGKLGLQYFVEIGNGRQYRDPALEQNPVASVFDSDSGKAVNLALEAKPTAIPGLQGGAGVYFDSINSPHQAHTAETIFHTNIVYKEALWEFIAEAYYIRHSPSGAATTHSKAWFVQLARQFGPVRPYLRYTYAEVPAKDNLYSLIGLTGSTRTATAGIRWDFITYAALKFQYDVENPADAARADNLSMQLAVTF